MNKEISERLMRAQHRFVKIQRSISFHGMSKSEFILLEMIRNKDGIYVSEIAKALRITPPAVSKMLRCLEKKKYIQRRVDAKDRRNTIVKITPKGDRARHNIQIQMEGLLNHTIERMGEKQAEKFISLMEQFNELFYEEIVKLKKMQEEPYEADF